MPHPFIARVAYSMKMLLKILLALILGSHRTTVANSDSCEKTQCRLVPQTNDLSTTFSTTASERGVRLFYLYVKVNNNTYRPTNPSNKLRPARWAWARDIQEPMLSFSYDYDILSWGLLHHFQVRMMRVWLLDQPSGCLSNLSLPCQDRLIARALLMDVTNDYFLKEKSQKRGTVQKPFVVCNIVLDERNNEWSKLFDGNLVYRCCSNSTKRVANETSVECGLHVKVSDWLHFFYHVINYTTIPMLFFWPAIILVLPDFLFTFTEEKEDAKDRQEDSSQTQNCRNSVTSNAEEVSCYTASRKDSLEPLLPGPPNTSSYGGCEEIETLPPPDNDDNKSQQTHDSELGGYNVTPGGTSTRSESGQNDDNKSHKTPDSEQESDKMIPVDDISPITITRLMRYCTGKSSVICSNYSKLLFLYYILLFIIYYYKLLFSLLYKDHDIKRAINIPGARLEGKLSEWFDMTTVYFDLRVEIIIVFVLSLIGLPLIPIFYIEPCDLKDVCSGCKKNPFYLRTDISEHLRAAPRHIFRVAKCLLLSNRCCFITFSECLKKSSTKSRCLAYMASRPSVHRFRKVAENCVSLCDRPLLWKVPFMCVCGPPCSILLIVLLIIFWGVILAVSILIYLPPFVVAAIIILFWNSPFWRLFLFAWHVVRQFHTGEPSKRIPCLSCTFKCLIEHCKTDNKGQAAAGNGNTHKQGNDSTESTKKITFQENQRKTEKKNTFDKEEEEIELRDKKSKASRKSKEAANAVDNSTGEGTSTVNENNRPNVSKDTCTGNANKQCSCSCCQYIFLTIFLSFVLAFVWASFVTVIACLSCRFVARMVGFVIVGLFWNSRETIPYITFSYVLMHHTYCCYSSIQSRYKEIKVMISKQPRSKGSGENIGEEGKRQDKATIFYGDKIPRDLFWFVCNDCKVLPLVDELCLMFVSVLAFAFVLFLAVAAIMFLGEENSAFPDVVTALLQAGAILISGKLPEWVFKKLIKGERFIGNEKIEKQEMVKQAVKDWHEKNPAGEV